SQIRVLKEPVDFYQTILDNIRTAQKRICIATLYVGNEQHELANELAEALRRQPELQIDILMDYNRGTRGLIQQQNSKASSKALQKSGASSVELLARILSATPDAEDRVRVSLYRSPAITSLHRQLVPPRWIEGIGVQHMKGYVFDDNIILSGANLNSEYFTTRQDRYMVFEQHSELADYFCGLAKAYSSVSPKVKLNKSKESGIEFVEPENETVAETKRLVDAHTAKWIATAPKAESLDTVVIPCLQAGPLNIRQDEETMTKLLQSFDSSASAGRPRIVLSTAYFNVASFLETLILSCRHATFDMLTASPEANGFYKARGISGHIPTAYSLFLKTFMKRIRRSNRDADFTVSEYKRDGWTFHGKGLWLYANQCDNGGDTKDEPEMTIIGSSNYGTRSYERDTEMQAIVITSNTDLRRQLATEVKDLMAHSSRATLEEL
ncbi:hypothetical protein GQ42DRAFT_104619, partial [Ramicandelaber brevisporus]